MVRRSKSQSPDPAVSYFDHATPGSAQHSKHEKHRHRDYDRDQHGPETAQAIREHEKHDAVPQVFRPIRHQPGRNTTLAHGSFARRTISIPSILPK